MLGCALELRGRGKSINVESIHNFCNKTPAGKSLKDFHKVRKLGLSNIRVSVASQERSVYVRVTPYHFVTHHTTQIAI